MKSMNRMGRLFLLSFVVITLIGITAVTAEEYSDDGGDIGVIEEGAYADILIVNGNPIEGISVIGGSLEWFDAKPHSFLYTRLRIPIRMWLGCRPGDDDVPQYNTIASIVFGCYPVKE